MTRGGHPCVALETSQGVQRMLEVWGRFNAAVGACVSGRAFFSCACKWAMTVRAAMLNAALS